MKTEEKFKIWDATNPTIGEVEAYLALLCGNTPLQLVYKTADNKFLFVNEVIPKANFIGIVVKDMVLFARGFSKSDIPLGKQDLSVQFICKWIRATPLYSENAHPIYENDVKLLYNNFNDFLTTMKILSYHKVKMPEIKYYDEIAWVKAPTDENSKDYFCTHDDGGARLDYYLEMYGDILICSPKEDLK